MSNEVVIHDAAADRWLRFREPCRVIRADRIEDVVSALRVAEHLVKEQDLFAAGFISYEAAPAFDRALSAKPLTAFPLLWFGIYSRPQEIQIPLPALESAGVLESWRPTISRAAYDRAIHQIKEHIAAGETYQVNYTFRLRTPFPADAWKLFLELIEAQGANYGAFVDTGQFVICSASPELFFRLDGRQLTVRPMKGTAARGLTLAEDEFQAHWLHNSEKNRAENVMIVDMMRNDVGRIADTGSVRVPRLYDVERYPTVWQMTSTVTGTTDAPVCGIMGALFPCASVTGAPKPRTMRIIAGLETTPRRVYTGSIGFISPGRKAQFNVAIRTVIVDREKCLAEYGCGGGIVWDSGSADEYEECRIKAAVLKEKMPVFSLLETMLWTPGSGCFLLFYHLKRLRDSANYFGIPLNMAGVQEAIMTCAASLPRVPHKLRLLVARDGAVSCEATPLDNDIRPGAISLKIAPTPVDVADRFLYHKTTHRTVYDCAKASCPDCDDVVLWNERNEVTETSTANLVIRLDRELVTPPVWCGLLPGTFRAWLLDHEQVRERVITVEDLKRSRRIYAVNSVRKWREAFLKFA